MTRARDIADAGVKVNYLDNVGADINTTYAPLASPTFTGTTDISSGATLPDGTMCGFTETTTTPTGSQGTDTGYTTLTGSSVDYTPVDGSSYVVYEYQFGFTGRDNNPLLYWQSYYDGSIIANMDSGFYFSYGDSNAGAGYMQITFTLPSWSGSKNLHIKYKVHNASYKAKFHQAVYPSDNYIKIFRRTYSVM
tara:strand:+ start:836 stop:1414 length:579 start_codon:yes stop_codon:yes gene_type:complete